MAFGPENLGVPTEEIRKSVSDQALAQTGMTSFAKRAAYVVWRTKAKGGHRRCIGYAAAAYHFGRTDLHAGPRRP